MDNFQSFQKSLRQDPLCLSDGPEAGNGPPVSLNPARRQAA